ncbi:MAG: alpha-hydroxy-acid oxidizing protein [Clostridiales bacterium]|jgi:isopentenyl diphosphate isomerase/L-lactate dehydrogenase-like FMN-dependent dehydrogenase|nr:alpha-hydroxy-acid oxidizing protein [Clostridiales bacterium]
MANGGDTSKITRDYFDSLLLEMRHIDAVKPTTETVIYGEKFSSPIMTAALSHLDKVRPNGTVLMAQGAYASKSAMWIGMGDEEELEAIIETGAKTIKIIKPYADNDVILKKIEHAEKSGALAVGIDIDHAFGSISEWDYILGLRMSPKSFDEIKSFVNATKLPFIIKGVLSLQDALKCLEAGVNGIVVSHHHGMVDYALPPLMILPKIAKAVGGKFPIFVDCCFERGLDVFKALALGATAVSVGRALMKPLKDDGADGVQKYIEEMKHELQWAMAVTCSKNPSSIDPTILWNK